MAVDSFFANTRKRKRPAKTTSTIQRKGPASKAQPKGRPAASKTADSDIEGDEDDDDHFNANLSAESDEESSEEEIKETAAEKRVRLAKAYLGSIEETLDGSNVLHLTYTLVLIIQIF
jgi:ribosomal RNA-processing protein 9